MYLSSHLHDNNYQPEKDVDALFVSFQTNWLVNPKCYHIPMVQKTYTRDKIIRLLAGHNVAGVKFTRQKYQCNVSVSDVDKMLQ